MPLVARMLRMDADSVSPGGGAEIRHILTLPQGDLTHAVCPAGQVSPTHHLPELQEQYYVLAGVGEIWRATDEREAATTLRPGRWAEMPAGMRFQFRSDRGVALVFLVAVLPSWRSDLFHTIADGAWDAGAPAQMPLTDAAALVEDWLSGDFDWGGRTEVPQTPPIDPIGSLQQGGLANWRLEAGTCSMAVRHQAVSQLWYVISGHGELWRANGDGDQSVTLLWPGVGFDIPAGTDFQVRASGQEALRVVLLSMPRHTQAAGPEHTTGPWEAGSVR